MPQKYDDKLDAEDEYKLFCEADKAWENGDLRAAFELFLAMAMRGYQPSWLNVGYFFHSGLYVKRDLAKAEYWYHKAYRSGDSSGASNIAMLHKQGSRWGRMSWWLRKSLAMGNEEVRLEIGRVYECGRGCDRNPAKAEHFYRRLLSSEFVSEGAKEDANQGLGRLGRRGSGKDFGTKRVLR